MNKYILMIILMIILGLYLYDVTREGNRNEKDTEEDEDPVKREEAEKLLKLEETKGKDIKVLENDAKIYKNTLKCFEHREKQMNAKVNEAINNRNIQKDKSKKKTMALMDMAGKI